MIWLAPEILELKLYDQQVDTYAFGVVIWEILARKDFFGDVAFMSDLRDLIVTGNRPEVPQCPAEFKAVIEQCWVCSIYIGNYYAN